MHMVDIQCIVTTIAWVGTCTNADDSVNINDATGGSMPGQVMQGNHVL